MSRDQRIKIFELSAIDMTLYKFVLPLMRELKAEDFDVICGASDHGYLDILSQEGFRTYNISISRNLNPLSMFRSIVQLTKILRKEKVTILHVHTPIAALVGRIAAFFSGVVVKIYTVHGFILSPRPYYMVERFMARHFTDYIFTVNQEDYDLALKKRFIHKYRLTNINSVGIDTKYFSPDTLSASVIDKYRENFNIDSNTIIIGFVGRIVKPKGVLDLIQAYLLVRREFNCKLLLVGPWDMDERPEESIIDTINNIIAAEGLVDDIIMPGHREDIVELLGIMDVFVLPSYREGMPISLLEAMSMGKSVIGANVRGVREEITEDCGILYEPGNIKQLSHSLSHVLRNENIRISYGKNARQRVIDNYSQNIVLLRQLKVFQYIKDKINNKDKG